MGVSNYRAMCEVIEHLIVRHNCRIIHFVSGPEWHLENRERIEAYRDTLKKHGLPFEESMEEPAWKWRR